MTKLFIKIGSIVAILLMFSPIVILYYNQKIDKYWWIILILAICYDIYIYSIITKQQSMEHEKEHYYKFVKNADKKLNISLTSEEKFKNLEDYTENMLKKYFD